MKLLKLKLHWQMATALGSWRFLRCVATRLDRIHGLDRTYVCKCAGYGGEYR